MIGETLQQVWKNTKCLMIMLYAWHTIRSWSWDYEKNQTIDKHVQEELKEKGHWREVFLRIFAVVKTLTQRNLAFRGDNEKLGEANNGNFLGLI